MARPIEYEDECRDNSITCIFLCEFHHTAGPKIICQVKSILERLHHLVVRFAFNFYFQVPEDHISKDDFEAVSVYIIPKAQLFRNVITM